MTLKDFIQSEQYKKDLEELQGVEFAFSNDYLTYFFQHLVDGSEVKRYISYYLEDFGEIAACVVEDDECLCVFTLINKNSEKFEPLEYKGKIEVRRYPKGILIEPNVFSDVLLEDAILDVIEEIK